MVQRYSTYGADWDCETYPDDKGELIKYEDYAALEQELLALRKEREAAVPVSESGHVRREVHVGGNTWVQCSTQAYERAKGEGKITRELYERPAPPVAVPVAWRHDDGPFALGVLTRSKSVAESWIANGWKVTPLYTAPPAPVVPKIDRKAICNKAHWLCARSPGATFYNAADFALDEVMGLLEQKK